MVEVDVTAKLKSLKVSNKLSLCSSSLSRTSSNDWSPAVTVFRKTDPLYT